jgi:hypothetical protein
MASVNRRFTNTKGQIGLQPALLNLLLESAIQLLELYTSTDVL